MESTMQMLTDVNLVR